MTTRRHGGAYSPALRKFLLWSLAGLASLLLLGFLGYAQLLTWLQGEGFRDRLENMLASKTQATEAEISGTLHIDANHLTLQGIRLQRPGQLRGLEARNLRAELKRAALLDRELHLTRLMEEECCFTLEADATINAAGSATNKQAAGRPATPGFLAGLAPTRARLDQMDCKDFNATLNLGGREYTLADSSLSATPAPHQGKGSWELRLNNGRVRTPLPILGDCSLKGAILTINDKLATLSDARLMLSPGELIVNAARQQNKGDWSADIRANSMDISRIIGPDWKKRLSGVVYGRLRADGNAEGLKQAEGRLSLQQGVLEMLPFLAQLPVGDTYPYRSLRLEKATARLSYPHADAARNIQKAWLLDEIDLRAQGGWLRVQGHALVDADGSLGGALLIGLPDNVAARLVPAESPLHQSIFNAEGEKGYQWLRLNLSGSLSNPQEDLSVRLMTLIGSDLAKTASTLQQLLLPGTGADTQSPASPGDAKPASNTPGQLIREAGKAAGDIISTGLRSLF